MTDKNTTKRSPRAMPVEAVITRYKSSQRQQTHSKRRFKTVAKPKTPSSQDKQYGREGQKMNALKPKKTEGIVKPDNDKFEYYPDKMKRNVEYKRVVLHPRHCLKVIGGVKSCNKRKLRVPKKDVKIRRNSDASMLSEIEPKSPEHKDHPTELTVKDMVLLIEEEGSLNDEDLLEILTCPSPVWWEDPPDGFIEDPIFTRSKPVERKSIKKQLLEEQNKEAERRKQREKQSTLEGRREGKNNSENWTVKNREVNFMKKRSKLESLLDNIRNKVNHVTDSCEPADENIADNFKIAENCDKTINNCESNKNNISTITTSKNIAKNLKHKKLNTNRVKKCVKKVDSNWCKRKNVLAKVNSKKNPINVCSTRLRRIQRHTNCKNKRKVKVITRKGVVKDGYINCNKLCNERDYKREPQKRVDGKNVNTTESNGGISSSESVENLLDIDEDEIFSLENMDIPIASNTTVKPIEHSVVKLKELIDYQPTFNDEFCTKINNVILNDNNPKLKMLSYNADGDNSMDHEFSDNQLISNEVVKYIDDANCENEHTSNVLKKGKTEQVKNKNTFAKNLTLDNKISKRNTVSNSTVDNLESANLNESLLDESRDNLPIRDTKSTIDVDVDPVSTKPNKRYSSVGNEDDICLKGTKHLNSKPASNTQFNNIKDDFTNVAPNQNLKIDDACTGKVEISNNSLNVNKRNKNESYTTIGDIVSSDQTNVDCIIIDDDINEDDDGSFEDKNTANNSFNQNPTIEIDDNDQEKNLQLISKCENKNEINNSRRSSVDSQTSDKNMSVEYLDMSLLDEDENKIELECNDNELSFESDDISQESIQSCNESVREHFNSDLDVSEVNESCDNEVIESINQPDDKCKHGKVFENKCKPLKFKTSNTMNEKEKNAKSEVRLLDMNEIEDAEFINYDVEYLTEFDEMDTVSIDIGIENFNNINNKTNASTKDLHKQVKPHNIEAINNKLNSNTNESSDNAVKSNEINPESSKNNKHINNYYKQHKNNETIANKNKLNGNKWKKIEKIYCESCNFKNKSILISESDTIKYCLLCSSIYDTQKCKYCVRKLKKKCSCNVNIYTCDKCNLTVSNKKKIIRHLKICSSKNIKFHKYSN